MAGISRSVTRSVTQRGVVRAIANARFGTLRDAVINALFSNSEQGALYDPSDLSTLYQDSAGTTPVTADGDPVGLMLDLSTPITTVGEVAYDESIGPLGDAFVFRGTATQVSGKTWTLETTSTASGQFGVGVASSDNFLPADTLYEVTVDATISKADATHSLDLTLSVGQNSGNVATILSMTESGSYTARFYTPDALGGDTLTLLSRNGTATIGDTFTVNITVTELASGNHGNQATAAERPAYDLTNSIHSIAHDLVDDSLVATFPDLGTDATVKYVTSGGITTLTNQTISGDYTLPQATWQGVIVYEGPMTTAQANAADKWLNAKAGL